MEVSQKSDSLTSKVTKSNFTKQEDIVTNFLLTKGMTVADFGCGAGYFTIPIAKAVGNTGKVYAVDVLSTALEYVGSQVKLLGLSNVETVRANIEVVGGNSIPAESVDLVLLISVLFQCDNPEDVLREARRILKSTGRIVVIDWIPGKFFNAANFHKCISEEDAKKMALRNGLKVVDTMCVNEMNYGFVLQIV